MSGSPPAVSGVVGIRTNKAKRGSGQSETTQNTLIERVEVVCEEGVYRGVGHIKACCVIVCVIVCVV